MNSQKNITVVIQSRIDEFCSKYGEKETLIVFKTLQCGKPYDLTFYKSDVDNNTYICWEEYDDDRCEINMVERYFDLKHLDNKVWNEFIVNHQTTIDERETKLKEQNKIKLEKEIEYKRSVLKNYQQELEYLENELNGEL